MRAKYDSIFVSMEKLQAGSPALSIARPAIAQARSSDQRLYHARSRLQIDQDLQPKLEIHFIAFPTMMKQTYAMKEKFVKLILRNIRITAQ